MSKGASSQGATRVHAVILTRDRPETLARCVDTALFSLGADDALTVLDDSCAMISPANSAVLVQAARRSVVPLTCLRAEQLHDLIAMASGGQRALWQSRTAQRDIAPLRNITLLLSAAVDAPTTILIDDDMCCYNLEATHRILDMHYHTLGPVVVGAEIGGVSELDVVTRLSDALHVLESKTHNSAAATAELFRVHPDSHDLNGAEGEHLSAGYMAFRLPTRELFAFPPGYNEDWLWCLLHGASGATRLLRENQEVAHEPPSLRQSTRDDILFELSGDLIFDCLAELRNPRPSRPESVLEDLANCAPGRSMIPSARAEAVLKRALGLRGDGHGCALADLESYGLTALRNVLQAGELETDGTSTLRIWSVDATAKHKSFAITLGDVTVRHALWQAMKEGIK